MPIARTPHVELFYERRGAGAPLLLIMGMSGTHLLWGGAFLEALTAGGAVETIAYDHRGVGASTRLNGALSTAGLAEDALALLDALALQSVHVMGISMGGMIAQELALRAPERVRSLTLGCTSCGGPGSSLADDDVGAQLARGLQSGDRELAIRSTWEVNVSPALAADERAYAAFRALVLERPVSFRVILAQLRAVHEHDTSARIGALQMPAQIIHGAADRMIPVPNASLLAQRVPGARLVVLDDVGHLFWWERPERSAELVRELIAAGDARPGD
jgi:pimeloyl-ACP methyl ester carboxylesterase